MQCGFDPYGFALVKVMLDVWDQLAFSHCQVFIFSSSIPCKHNSTNQQITQQWRKCLSSVLGCRCWGHQQQLLPTVDRFFVTNTWGHDKYALENWDIKVNYFTPDSLVHLKSFPQEFMEEIVPSISVVEPLDKTRNEGRKDGLCSEQKFFYKNEIEANAWQQ